VTTAAVSFGPFRGGPSSRVGGPCTGSSPIRYSSVTN